MKTIIALTDFSATALNAVNYAADMACIICSNLSLMYVCPITPAINEVPVSVLLLEKQVADAEEQMRLLKENIIYRTRDRIHITTIVKQGVVVPEIEVYCASVKPYAVVMGTESANALERFLIEGITISVMQQLSWPLIVVPPDVKFESLRKIGLACDLKNVIETIPLKEIKSLVAAFHAELLVLHVSTENGDSFSVETVKESAWLQEILGDLNPKYHFITDTDIDNAINEFADKNDLDLLIIIPKNHNLLSKIFKHSHSKRLVLHTHVPVMAIHE